MGLKHLRYRQRNLKIGLPKPERFALLRKMTDALVEHERLETTWSKAKALRVWMQPMITWSRKIRYNQTTSRGRETLSYKLEERCDKPSTIEKCYEILAERYRYRTGGFVRILKTRRRYRDDAQMAFIEFVDREGELRSAKPIATKLGSEHFQFQKQYWGDYPLTYPNSLRMIDNYNKTHSKKTHIKELLEKDNIKLEKLLEKSNNPIHKRTAKLMNISNNNEIRSINKIDEIDKIDKLDNVHKINIIKPTHSTKLVTNDMIKYNINDKNDEILDINGFEDDTARDVKLRFLKQRQKTRENKQLFKSLDLTNENMYEFVPIGNDGNADDEHDDGDSDYYESEDETEYQSDNDDQNDENPRRKYPVAQQQTQ